MDSYRLTCAGLLFPAMMLACGGGGGGIGDCVDQDGDGFNVQSQTCVAAVYDCDDGNAAVYPGAQEIPENGFDEDCDGVDATICVDQDADGYFAKIDGCTKDVYDCDDAKADVYPGAAETCGNGIDENCDGSDSICPPQCEDKDGDGYGKGAGCKGPDCDDENKLAHPGAVEVCENGIDDDCSGGDALCPTHCTDNDQDGYGDGDGCKGPDCDDYNKAVNPGAEEICGNKVDEDCDGKDDECPVQCADYDGDGYGDGPDCAGPDCNDYNKDVNPGATEVCGNGKDDDCVGGDEECPPECVDKDEDGYGEGAACNGPDCDDTDSDVNPGAEEICGNSEDEDCDGVDKPCDSCEDDDGDGYGEGNLCTGPDCDDGNPDVHPAAVEICGNGIDEDCSGEDEVCPDDCVDNDGDGYGDGVDCAGEDCDDTNADIHPGAEDLCGNGTDEDCSGADAVCEDVCEKDGDCPVGQICDLSDKKCRYAKVWEWWAPRVYTDIHTKALDEDKLWDLFTQFDFDGDWIGANNDANVDKHDKPAAVYYSFVKTSTHWFLGYYFYFPVSWDVSWVGLGSPQIDYENAMQGVLIVVEQDGSTYGKPILMETTSEGTFKQYKFPGINLSGGVESIDGQVKFDDTGHHPVIYIEAENHTVLASGKDWDTNGFDGDDGVQYGYGFESTVPSDFSGKASTSYDLVALKDTLWDQRFDISSAGTPYVSFGTFACDDNCNNGSSRAPWRFADINDLTMDGEFLYNPADHARRLFTSGWGLYSHQYVYNPYGVKVQVEDLEVLKDADASLLWGKGSDVYIVLTMLDGSCNWIEVLDQPGALPYNGGYQNSFKKDNVPAGTLLFMAQEIGRDYFYGIRCPDEDLFGIQVRDADFEFDDWLMDPEKVHYYDYNGKTFLDWVHSNSFVAVGEFLGL